jgi:hypothetical protein
MVRGTLGRLWKKGRVRLIDHDTRFWAGVAAAFLKRSAA